MSSPQGVRVKPHIRKQGNKSCADGRSLQKQHSWILHSLFTCPRDSLAQGYHGLHLSALVMAVLHNGVGAVLCYRYRDTNTPSALNLSSALPMPRTSSSLGSCAAQWVCTIASIHHIVADKQVYISESYATYCKIHSTHTVSNKCT